MKIVSEQLRFNLSGYSRSSRGRSIGAGSSTNTPYRESRSVEENHQSTAFNQNMKHACRLVCVKLRSLRLCTVAVSKIGQNAKECLHCPTSHWSMSAVNNLGGPRSTNDLISRNTRSIIIVVQWKEGRSTRWSDVTRY